MKKLFLMLAAFSVATMVSGCGRMLFNASNTTGTLTEVKLTEGNFRVVKKVDGFASATYVFGIGGLSNVRDNAVSNMLKKAELKGSQTIANVYVHSHVSTLLGIFTRISYSATGEVIEFYDDTVRADMRSDDTTSTDTVEPAMLQITNKDRYEVGDIFYDGTKYGLVIEVYPDGKHGKIMNPEIVKDVLWCTADNIAYVGVKDYEKGKNNMDKIKSIPDWQSKYPAFAKCAELGEEWYIPSIKELQKLYFVRNSLNVPDIWRAATPIWSSTETNKSGVKTLWGSGNLSKEKTGYLVTIAEF